MYDCSSFAALPETVGSLQQLRELSLRDCPCVQLLPESVGGLQHLHTLSVRACQCFTSLPETLGKLQALQVLDLDGCHSLETLPQSSSQLTSLHTLQIEGTRLPTARDDELTLWESIRALLQTGSVPTSKGSSALQGTAENRQRIEQILQLQGQQQHQVQPNAEQQLDRHLVDMQRVVLLLGFAGAAACLVVLVAKAYKRAPGDTARCAV